jgi:hypothetical protein
MHALDLEANILGEDLAVWSEIEDIHEVHSVHEDSTEGEMTVTSSDDMPSLVDADDDSDHDNFEVPAEVNNVVLTMPAYPALPTINIRYLDDVVHNDNMTTTNNTKDIICYKCNLPC